MTKAQRKKQLDQEIKNITAQLIAKYRPEKIILFGSAAHGKFGHDSDLDWLIIKKETPYYGIDRMREVHRLVDTDMACDFLVMRPTEIKKRLSWEDPFVEEMVYNGKVLYG